MTPQLTKIAECLSESHAREIKLARCLAESLKRIQSLESASKTKDTKAKAAELRFNALMRELSEHYAKRTAENEELIRQLEAKIEVDFPAQLAALKTEFATPAAQAAAPQSFNPRGAYEPGEKYKPFDYVSSNGSSYIALVENPTQPPSKKSKQWMLVAARGAGGGDSGGGVTGLGTAATRDVGQAAGNVLELSANGIVSLGGGVVNGKLQIWDQDDGRYLKLYSVASEIRIENTSGAFLSLDVGNFGGAFHFVSNTTYRDYDFPDASGTLALLSQVGDRYLTSSTTSNTVSNGAKTFTVGTGLAYSPTQDITIVFNASNHMHAAVTSYDSATGALVVDVNSHTGSGTYAVWTVNVGGIGAGAIPSGGTTGQVLAKLSSTNYDDAWVTPTVAVGGITGLGTGVATALAINVGTAGAAIVNGGALGTPSSGTVTNLTGTASININGTVGATTPAAGAFTTLNASGLTRVGTATTADALSDVLIATSATTQRGLTIQGKASQTAPLLRIVESTNNAANNGWQFDANAVYWTGSGTAGGYLNQAVMITQPGFFYKWNSSTTNVFSAATFSLGPTVAGSKILAIGNGTQFDTSGGISCAQILLDKTITSAGTTGAQTINKTSGSVNFAAAATSLVVTNSFCTVNSVIQCTVGTNDTTLKSVAAVAAAGSFTMHANAAATAETRVFFSITN